MPVRLYLLHRRKFYCILGGAKIFKKFSHSYFNNFHNTFNTLKNVQKCFMGRGVAAKPPLISTYSLIYLYIREISTFYNFSV